MTPEKAILRSGMRREDRHPAPLNPEYVSVEERTEADFIAFAEKFAKHLVFYGYDNLPGGDWSSMFAAGAKDIAAYLEAPARFAVDPDVEPALRVKQGEKLALLTKPHLALFLAFLRLLRYPARDFKGLTKRHLDFYYNEVLSLKKRKGEPDKVHVVFRPADSASEHPVAKGSLLNAGSDDDGKPVYYELTEEILVNRSEAASVKTLGIAKKQISLEDMRRADENGFDAILKWTLGQYFQGDELPPYPLGTIWDEDVDLSFLMALHQKIEKGELTGEKLAEAENYISNLLCFTKMEDFHYCLDIQKREEEQIDFPTPEEWKTVCLHLESAFQKKHLLKRRDVFMREREAGGMENVFRLALGMPLPEDHLPPMPGVEDTFETLYRDLMQEPEESDRFKLAARYVSRDLGMSPSDFKSVMDVETRFQGGQATEDDWKRACDLLVRAETEKRNLAPPDPLKKDIRFLEHKSIADAAPGAALDMERSRAFGERDLASGVQEIDLSRYYNPGFAVSSPLLRMKGGERTIVMEAACKAKDFPMAALKTLADENRLLFDVYLSGEKEPLHIDPAEESESIRTEIDMLGRDVVRNYNEEELELLGVARGVSATIEINDCLLLDDGSESLLGIWRVISADRSGANWNLALRFLGRLKDLWQRQIVKPGSAGFMEIASPAGATDLSKAEIVEEKMEIRIKKPVAGTRYFDPDDDPGAFVVWGDGGVFQIMSIAEPSRVSVEYLGRIPGYEADAPKKYGQLDFKNASSIEQKVSFTGVRIPENKEKLYFTVNDAERLLLFDNGLALKISRLIPGEETGEEKEEEKEKRFQNARVATLSPRTPAPLEFNEYKTPIIRKQASYPGFRFTITLDKDKPAVLPTPDAPPEPGLDPLLPWIKIRLRHMETSEHTGGSVDLAYEYFSSIKLHNITLKIEVESAVDLKMRADSTVMDPRNPFEPFGYTPSEGAALYFTSPELSQKKLDSIDIKIRWQGLPDDLKDHYEAYTRAGVRIVPEKLDPESFNLQLSLLNNGAWMDMELPRPFFKADRRGNRWEHYENGFDRSGYYTLGDPGEEDSDDPLDYPRHFRLQLLEPDFQHTAYPLVMRKIALSDALKDMEVYPPYTPKIDEFTIDYTASAVIDPFSENYRKSPERAAHVHPFGCVDMAHTVPPGQEEFGAFFLPSFPGEGELYIGVRDIIPGQTVSLFFQAVPGTGEPGAGLPVTRMYYRTRTGWRQFDPADILDDSTYGLVFTGLIRLLLPPDASDSGPLMPEGMHWIRISADRNAAAASDMEDIKTNGALARFHYHENGGDPSARPLAQNSITGLVSPYPAIRTVEQPYPSFHVRGPENEAGFYARVSERIGCGGRAAAPGDYEKLALERFSEIRHVKCLCGGEHPRENPREHHPGKTTLVVIPDLSHDPSNLELEPGVSLSVLTDIKEYIEPLAPPSAEITVKNPLYRQVLYRLAVRFNEGFGAGYYSRVIQEDIKRFLSPWAFESTAGIAFGGVKYRSSLVHYVEKLPYVDYVALVKTFEQHEGAEDYELKYTFIEDGAARCRRPDEVLSSSPFHIIDVITDDVFREEDFAGIGYMIIGLDFIVE